MAVEVTTTASVEDRNGDTLTAEITTLSCGELVVDVSTSQSPVWLTPEDARAFGAELIAFAEHIEWRQTQDG